MEGLSIYTSFPSLRVVEDIDKEDFRSPRFSSLRVVDDVNGRLFMPRFPSLRVAEDMNGRPFRPPRFPSLRVVKDVNGRPFRPHSFPTVRVVEDMNGDFSVTPFPLYTGGGRREDGGLSSYISLYGWKM
ncbi:hypothetical protein AVEN_249186-1 [Araneus ventricosus]|uniref:Uncharacterized protein n=1 Tax=Araneus ventricosus TaxID=182803 RepID=A0A4Y2V2A8_ARAVE|nr:hypothetical protein AVEN_249186-1 [Araneus ventricosus]